MSSVIISLSTIPVSSLLMISPGKCQGGVILSMIFIFCIGTIRNPNLDPTEQELSTATGAVNGYTTRGTSTIKARSGGASTTYQSTGAVSVNSTYSYVNTNTLVTGKITKSKGYYKSCSVSFTAPNGCRSVKVSSSHNVSAAGQSWTASTSKIYGD